MPEFNGSIPAAIGRIQASYSNGNPWMRVPEYDYTYDCFAEVESRDFPVIERDALRTETVLEVYKGLLAGFASIGSWTYVNGFNGSLKATASISASWVEGYVTTVDFVAKASISGEFFKKDTRDNWVLWSKIGSVSTKIDTVNDAGYRPMEWNGYVYAIKPFGKGAIVYGSDGIALLYPATTPFPTFGYVNISTVGLISKDAVCVTERGHIYVNAKGQLCTLAETDVTKRSAASEVVLGYEEFLLPLAANGRKVVVFYDPLKKQVHISNGLKSFVLAEGGLGMGFVGLTSVGKKDGTVLYIGPAALVTPQPFHICTDTLDFGMREMKTLTWLCLGTDSSVPIYAAVDWRNSKDAAFQTSPFKLVNKEGAVRIGLTAVEFRIRIKAETYSYFELDYLQAKIQTSDQRFTRGAMAGGGQ